MTSLCHPILNTSSELEINIYCMDSKAGEKVDQFADMVSELIFLCVKDFAFIDGS